MTEDVSGSCTHPPSFCCSPPWGSGGPRGLGSSLSSAPALCKASRPREGPSALPGVCRFKIKIEESFLST